MKTAQDTQGVKDLTKTHQGQRGFTLLETSVALVVMMVVGLGAASLFVYAVGANTTARDRELSMAVAQQQMERLRNTPFSRLDDTLTETGGNNKTVLSSERQYSVVTTVVNTVAGNANKRTITVQVTPVGSTRLVGADRFFGGVTLVTQRSVTTLGANWGPN